MLLVSVAGAVYQLPDTKMKSSANITFDGGYIHNLTNGLGQDAVAYSQLDRVTPQDFGAIVNDEVDDTDAMQHALDTGGYIYFPKGEYKLDPSVVNDASGIGGLSIKNDSIIEFAPGAIIKNLAHHETHYYMLTVLKRRNISIIGGIFDGNRAGNTEVTGEWGYGLIIASSSNIIVRGGTFKNCWGDGISITGWTPYAIHNNNIRIETVTCDFNRRGGLSIEDGIGVYVNGNFMNANGTDPEFGVCVEPYNNLVHVRGIVLDNIRTYNNSRGIIICPVYVFGDNPVDIKIKDPFDADSYKTDTDSIAAGLYFGPSSTNGTGRVVVENPTILNSDQNGISIAGWSGTGVDLDIINPTIINPNRLDSNTMSGAGIAWYQLWGVMPGANVNIFRPSFITDGTLPSYLFYYAESYGSAPIVDTPVAFCNTKNAPNTNYMMRGTINDPLRIDTAILSGISEPMSELNYHRYYNTSGWNYDHWKGLAGFSPGQVMTFTTSNNHKLKIYPEGDTCILPLSPTMSYGIESSGVDGESVTLRKSNDTAWIIDDIVGTWIAKA